MVKLILGRAGSGKTEYVFNRIKELADGGCSDILLIAPEQYSLICERRLLDTLGESRISCADNSTFTKICGDAQRLYGGDGLQKLSKGGKVILMYKAVQSVKDSLVLFNKKTDTLSFVSSMIDTYDEMKSCNLTSRQIYDMSRGIENDLLLKKLTDISAVMGAYENIIKDSYADPADDLIRLYKKLCGKNYFADRHVFLDGFNGFVAREYKLLELIIAEAQEVTITLCTDNAPVGDGELFSYVNKSADIIKSIADKAEVPIETHYLDGNYRYKSSALAAVEKSFCNQAVTDYNVCDGAVEIYAAKNITDECSQVSRRIRSLLRSGYRARDIAVITRDLNKYRAELSSSFKKYGVPYYNDERQPVNTQPLVVMIKYLLRCVNNSLRSDDIISLAKTGLTFLGDEEINALENYTYLWNINGMKWTKPFENSPRGFVNEITDSDRQRLEAINKTREALIIPILSFKNAAKSRDTRTICEAVYNTLIMFMADEKVRQYAVELSKSGMPALAAEQGRIWELVMEILNQLAVTAQGKITLKEFDHLFSLIIASEDLGSVPVGIDNVQFGQADRIRTDNPRAVFILGANEGEFPKAVSQSGLLSESERRIMLENDFKLYSYGDIQYAQEKYFAYTSCCCARERLFISYTGNTGRDAAPSEIVTSVKEALPDIREYKSSDIDDIELIETKENAFELMSERYFYTDAFYSSLKKYFENDGRFPAVAAMAENRDEKIESRELSSRLFGRDMYLSASRVEDFYNCPYRYFCKFGIAAKPRKKAEIDPMQRGTLIHYVLEKLLSSVGSRQLSQMSDSEINDLVNKFLDEYFREGMGNISDVSKRFMYNYRRLSKLICSVAVHLAHEFSESDFEAKAFELPIDCGKDVEPAVIELSDGGSVRIRGSVDRVDMYEKDGEKYVRVVDYKSGNKVFSLSDIMCGLNLQMFIYLFSLCSDKNAELSGIPAGVLYMHASRSVFPFESKREAKDKIDSEEDSSFKMKGIVLDDGEGKIPEAMEHDLRGKYIPVKLKANGTLTGQLISLEQLGQLNKKVDGLIKQMGEELHKGNIDRAPVRNKNHLHTCEYCDYADVCANKKAVVFNQKEDLSDAEVKEILGKEYGEDAELDE